MKRVYTNVGHLAIARADRLAELGELCRAKVVETAARI